MAERQAERDRTTGRTWCTSCRMAAIDISEPQVHFCAGQARGGSSCSCSLDGCHVPRIRPGQRTA